MNREQAQCLLGVAADAPRKDVVSAHRRLISTVHPDRCSGPEAERLAREATAARDVLLAPPELVFRSRRKSPARTRPRRKPPPASPPRTHTAQELDDVLLQYLQVVVRRAGRPVLVADLFRTLRRDFQARAVPLDDLRICLTRVIDDDFLAVGVARGYWEMDRDSVRPVGWTEGSAAAGEPESATGSARAEPVEGQPGRASGPVGEVRRRVAEDLRRWVRRVVRWAAAVAVASLFGLGAVGCSGMVMGAVATGELLLTFLALPVLVLGAAAGVWLMGRFGVSRGDLGGPAVFVPGLLVSAALFLLLVL